MWLSARESPVCRGRQLVGWGEPAGRVLTQEQPGLHHANLQVRAKVLHVTTASPAARLYFLHHMNAGLFPRLYDAFSSQRGHPGALLPEVTPGERFDFLVQGVHYMSSGWEQIRANSESREVVPVTNAASRVLGLASDRRGHLAGPEPSSTFPALHCKASSDWLLRLWRRLADGSLSSSWWKPAFSM